MTFWAGSWVQGSLRRVQRNSRWPSSVVPLWSDWFQLVVIRLSLSTRSAIRAASPFRSATAPARLAICRPSMATGTTMAINRRAASTSARVNPPSLIVRAADFIAHLVLAQRYPERNAVAAGQTQLLRAVVTNGAVRQKPDRRHGRMREIDPGHAGRAQPLKRVSRRSRRRGRGCFFNHLDLNAGVQVELHRFGVLFFKARFRVQADDAMRRV